MKGVNIDTALSYGHCNESLDMRFRKSTAPIRLYGDSNPTSYSTKAYVIEPGHINMHSRHVCHRGVPFSISQSLTVRLQLFVGQPDDVESVNAFTCCGYCQGRLFDIPVRVIWTPPEGQCIVLRPQVDGHCIGRNLTN